MKICVIGNSHVGALKKAWDSMSECYDSATITFFADRGAGLKDLVVNDGKLVPGTERLRRSLEFTSGGENVVDPSKYDLFLIYGLNAKGLFINPRRCYSSAVLEQAANDHVTETLSFNLVKGVRRLTGKNILVGHNPLPAYRGGEFKVVEPEEYLYGLEVVNDFVYSSVGAEIVAQPLHTIVNERYTNPLFTKGSERLGVGSKNDSESHPDNDYSHMNDEFGFVWLTAFLDNKCNLQSCGPCVLS